MPHSSVALREWCERSEVPFLSNFIHQQPEFALQAFENAYLPDPQGGELREKIGRFLRRPLQVCTCQPTYETRFWASISAAVAGCAGN